MNVEYPTHARFRHIHAPQGDGVHANVDYGTTAHNVITDPYDPILFTMAHRDGIQIIPQRHGEPWYQFGGGMSTGITIRGNRINSQNQMQGIFCSDGGHVDLTVQFNRVDTQSRHYVTLGGVLSGLISHNVRSDGRPCLVTLEPLRIGGNPIDPRTNRPAGNVWIVGFAPGNPRYAPLSDIAPRYRVETFHDYREGHHPRRKGDIYLRQFDWLRFRAFVESHPGLTPSQLQQTALKFGIKV